MQQETIGKFCWHAIIGHFWEKDGKPVLGTTYYAEYGSNGPGAATTKRVPWVRNVDSQMAALFRPESFLRGRDEWDARIEPAASVTGFKRGADSLLWW